MSSRVAPAKFGRVAVLVGAVALLVALAAHLVLPQCHEGGDDVPRGFGELRALSHAWLHESRCRSWTTRCQFSINRTSKDEIAVIVDPTHIDVVHGECLLTTDNTIAYFYSPNGAFRAKLGPSP